MHVVYGPNEAGKSTALRAVSGLLFGIPAQTQDAHRVQMSDLRVGAVLEARDGTVIEVVRRKGKKNTLLDASGNVLDESLLRRLYGGATEATFRALFGLDHVSLREGAEALLAGQGDVGASLFEAALGGGRGIRRLLQELDAEADALFTPKGHKRKLNEAIAAYQEARTSLRLSARSGESWVAQKRALDEAKAEREERVAALRAHKQALHRVERARRLLPVAARRERLLAALATLGEVKVLAADAGKLREAAVRARQHAATDISRIDQEVNEINLRRQALSVPAWLDDPAAERLTDLQDALGAHRKAAQDRPGLVATLSVHEAAVSALKTELGLSPRLGAEEEESPRPSATWGAAERARVLDLCRKEPALAQKHVQAKRILSDLERRQRARAVEWDALPAVQDSAPLRRVLRKVERDGDIETRLRDVNDERETLLAELARRVASLGLWMTMERAPAGVSREPLSPERLMALPVPPLESIEKYARESQSLSAREERLAEDLNALRGRERASNLKLSELARLGEIPSVDALAAARAARSTAWTRLRASWFAPLLPLVADDAPSATDARALAGFEQAMLRADEAADRLLREADRVAAAAALNAEAQDVRRLLADAEVQREHLALRRSAAAMSWSALWAATGVQPQAADEMRAWLNRWSESVELARRGERAAADASKMNEQIRRARAELLSAMGAAAPSNHDSGGAGDGGGDLATLCELAGEVAQAWEERAARRRMLQRELAELTEARERAAREAAEAEADLMAWRAEWVAAVAPLGLPPSASPAEAEAVLERVLSLTRKQAEADEVRRRLQGIERDARRFDEDVRRLVAALSPDLSARPVEEAAEILLQLRRDGLPARHARAEMEVDLQRKQQAKRIAVIACAAAEAELDALMRAAEVRELSALETAERRSAEALELRRTLRENEDQILELAEGATLEAAMQDFSGASADELDDRIERMRDELEGLEQQTQAAARTIGSVERGLREWDDPDDAGEGRAASASEEIQAHLTRIRDLASEYARLRLARRLLSAEIERYREQHQAPVLRRASDLLARLTMNRYTHLRADFDDSDQPVLRCVRADGTRVPVAGLSDGTRDQLYLALRLATLELQAAAAEPLPLILDDILIHFDDDRAGAALGVLAEHARGTQVVLFTHHARIVDLARRIVPPDALRVSRLESERPGVTHEDEQSL